MPDWEHEIDVLVRARYPIIYLVSYEEDRVTRSLKEVARKLNKEFLTWSIVRGLASDKNPKGDLGTKDPLPALEQVLNYKEPAIFLFRDFDSYLSDATVMRQVREVATALKTSKKTLVIVSPVLNLPTHLEKEIVVLDFQLPEFEDLHQILTAMIREVENNPNVQIDKSPEVQELLVKASLGLTANEAENVFAKALVSDGKLDASDVKVILSEKKQIIRKSGILEFFEAQEQFADVGGLDSLKDWLSNRRLAFSKKARDFGLPEPKGILLIGVQGCGKSLTAKAVAALWQLPLLRLDVGAVFSGIVGSSEENMRKAIRVSESIAPCILWLDELEKGFSGVQSSGASDGGTTSRVFGSFITWLQEKTKPVFVIATANQIEALPPELLRKGRFDEIFFVDLPSEAEREEILKIHLQKRKRAENLFDLKRLAAECPGFSGAEIEQAVISALYEAFEANREITTEDIVTAVKQTVPLSTTMKEAIEALRDWAKTRARLASTTPAEALAGIGRTLEL